MSLLHEEGFGEYSDGTGSARVRREKHRDVSREKDQFYYHFPNHWFSPFLMLPPFNIVSQVVVTPNPKTIITATS